MERKQNTPKPVRGRLNPRLAEQARARLLTKVGLSADEVLSHLHAHDPNVADVIDQPCKDHPCRVFGVAQALIELEQVVERPGKAEVRRLADLSIKVAARIRQLRARMGRGIEQVEKTIGDDRVRREHAWNVVRRRARPQGIRLPARDPSGDEADRRASEDQVSNVAMRTRESFARASEELTELLTELDRKARDLLTDPYDRRKRSAQSDPVIVAVTQSLRLTGGFGFDAIARLVDDGQKGTRKDRERRARDRVRARVPDMRRRFPVFDCVVSLDE